MMLTDKAIKIYGQRLEGSGPALGQRDPDRYLNPPARCLSCVPMA